MFAAIFSATTIEQTANNTTLIILGGFTLTGTVISSAFAFLSNRHAKTAKIEAAQANGAVNHKGPDEPRLFDMVSETHSQVQQLERTITHIDYRIDRLIDTNAVQHKAMSDRINVVDNKISDHISSVKSPISKESA